MARRVEEERSPFVSAIDMSESPITTTNTTKKEDWVGAFIGAILEGATVKAAARQAGVSNVAPYQRRKSDAVFARAWREAADIGTELLEQEAARRAFHGTIKPVFHKGERCGGVREYSDTLLIFLLKARNPARYRDGVEDRSVPVTINVNIVNVDATASLEGEPVAEVLSADYQQDGEGVREAAALS